MIQAFESFESFVEGIRAGAADAFNKEGGLLPSWFLQTETGEVLFLVTEYDTDLDRGFIDCAMRDTFVKQKVVRFVHVTEAWLVNTKEPVPEDYKGPKAKEHPDRIECLILIAEDINGHTTSGYCRIHRNPVDDTAMIDELKIVPGQPHADGGHFVGMFKRRSN